jgi:hypothetical protein
VAVPSVIKIKNFNITAFKPALKGSFFAHPCFAGHPYEVKARSNAYMKM